jgi:hypothetical protein
MNLFCHHFSKSCPLLVDFWRISGGITSKTALGESEESYSDLHESGNRGTQIRVMRGLGVLLAKYYL